MTTTTIVTAETTVQTLIDAGVTLAQLQALVDRKSSPAGANVERGAFAEEIYALMLENPTAQWKNGGLLKNWFSGKQADAELEKQRVKRHQEISRALADLAKDGRITKDRSGESASTTFYTVVAEKMPVAETAADADADAADDAK